MSNKWHKRFLELADLISTWSKDPSSKIGAVIVDEDNRIVSTGYNGFAKNVKDTEERYENREIKYKIVLHAEENALSYARRDLSGCVLYVSGLMPCAHCASLIIQNGIKKVITWKKEVPERWKDSMELTKEIFSEAGVEMIEIEKED